MLTILSDNDKLESTDSVANAMTRIDQIKMIENLNLLMHSSDNWPKFEQLKAIWDEVNEYLMKSFEIISD
ncbi:hypothetical protein SAMN05216341_101179 [Leuconostocaceae bacterium R-53105]|uniref:Uncharacterized protein n=1 Tax=Convivina intestini TaxID=1505726 RepID=A0A2U1DFE8_9LACO|nr:hypothetical protein C7384_101187 [Convivina intestini]CAH1851108.1 hypothetical protein R077811_00226 [Convivina intestini]SDB82059.1 hypothetical protein SAMN05216341_101179 [Leuconostocaceae bacterium R-53105]